MSSPARVALSIRKHGDDHGNGANRAQECACCWETDAAIPSLSSSYDAFNLYIVFDHIHAGEQLHPSRYGSLHGQSRLLEAEPFRFRMGFSQSPTTILILFDIIRHYPPHPLTRTHTRLLQQRQFFFSLLLFCVLLKLSTFTIRPGQPFLSLILQVARFILLVNY